jgi:hypothetical protein
MTQRLLAFALYSLLTLKKIRRCYSSTAARGGSLIGAVGVTTVGFPRLGERGL